MLDRVTEWGPSSPVRRTNRGVLVRDIPFGSLDATALMGADLVELEARAEQLGFQNGDIFSDTTTRGTVRQRRSFPSSAKATWSPEEKLRLALLSLDAWSSEEIAEAFTRAGRPMSSDLVRRMQGAVLSDDAWAIAGEARLHRQRAKFLDLPPSVEEKLRELAYELQRLNGPKPIMPEDIFSVHMHKLGEEGRAIRNVSQKDTKQLRPADIIELTHERFIECKGMRKREYQEHMLTRMEALLPRGAAINLNALNRLFFLYLSDDAKDLWGISRRARRKNNGH